MRVLEYRDTPGQRTSPHDHPNSVMYVLIDFRRSLIDARGEGVDVALSQGETRWLSAQTHSGENIGDTPTHVLLVELKHSAKPAAHTMLGPS